MQILTFSMVGGGMLPDTNQLARILVMYKL